MPAPELPTAAELSSLATTVDDLRARLSRYVDALEARDDSSSLAVDLADVERSLHAAARRLAKIAD